MMNDKPIVLESAIHHALREMAQAIADEHGIQITDVFFRWDDIVGARGGRLIEIEVKTRSV